MTIDYVKSESLDRRRQRLTEAERRQLVELLREAGPGGDPWESPAAGVR